MKTLKIIGILFLTAMVSSLVGGGVIESVINSPEFLNPTFSEKSMIKPGVFLEMINAVSVAGIGILLFPVIKRWNKKSAVGYVVFRILESFACIFAAIIPLLLFWSGNESGGFSNHQLQGNLLLELRAAFAGVVIPLFFCLGALIFYTFLYRTKILPRFISVWGFIGVVSIIVLNLLNVNTGIGMALALPIILNEIFLGIWLLTKGMEKIRQWSLKQYTLKIDN